MNKEGIIEFLRPNLRKIWITIFIFFIIPVQFVDLGSAISGFSNSSGVSQIVPFGGIMTIGLIIANIQTSLPAFTNLNILWALSSLILSYFFSCLIIYFYNRLKPLNKKSKADI
jgi:hypothetical protein